ncbi:MAG: hypothetical protein K2K80_03820 [Clostridia bacterium]|nr:hypothetical protein [Clostridia bacterium]
MKFFHLIGDIFNVTAKASEIRHDEVKRPKSMVFGVTSIIYSVLSVVLAIGGAALLSVATDSLLAIFIIVIGAVLMGGAVATFIGALVRVIAQLSINRRAIGWIALIVFLGIIAAIIVGIVYVLG